MKKKKVLGRKKLSKINKNNSAKKSKDESFNIETTAFEHQLRFIKDTSRLKALFCTRRAAKSYTGGLYLIHEALATPRCNCLFIALTRETAKGIIWKDILKELDIRFKLGMVFNGTALTATLPNGSVIWVTGADADEDEMNKLLGKKYRLAVIDEASMFTVNMHQLVYGILKPATADQRGSICLLGTASNITRGLFYDITNNIESGWSVHQWTAFDNPHIKDQWAEELKEIDEKRPAFRETALYKQWYLNQWVIDENALVYKFNRKRNDIHQAPQFEQASHYILGITIGHSPDPSGFVIAYYNDASPLLYVMHSEKHPNVDAAIIAKKINEFDKKYDFEVQVIFGLTEATVSEMNVRHECHTIYADQKPKEKEHFINLFNSDLNHQKILFLPQAEALKDELETIVWETDSSGKIKLPRKEHENIPNQLSSALLSLWRHTHYYLYNSKPGVKQEEDWEKRHIAKLTEDVRRGQNQHHFDNEFLPPDELFDFDKDDLI